MINVLAHFCYVEQVNLSYLDRFHKKFMLKPKTIIQGEPKHCNCISGSLAQGTAQ